MLTRLEHHVTKQMIKEGLIQVEDEEIYLFGLKKMAENAITLLSMLIIACVLGRVWELIIFIISFKTIREYAGGYHATTRVRCYFMTVGMIILVLSIQNYIRLHSYIALGIWVVCGVVLFCLAPIEAENKPLDEEEKVLYKKKARYIWCTQSICLIIAIYTQHLSVYENITLANICVAIALLTQRCKLQIIAYLNK